MAKYPEGRQQSAVLALLDWAQRQNEEGHYVTDAAIDNIEMLDMARIRVVEVATFFTMINLSPVGKYPRNAAPRHLAGCGDQARCAMPSRTILVSTMETTEDGLFTLMEVECLGACANAPIVQVNDNYEDLDGDSVIGVLDAETRRKPAHGPQIDRENSAPGWSADLVDMKFGGE